MPDKLRLAKFHIRGRTFRACLYNEAGRRVFSASGEGWTRANREECYRWAAEHGSPIPRIPRDERQEVSR